MSNYFTDNDDLRFYMEKGIDWAQLLDHVEFSRAVPGAPPTTPKKKSTRTRLRTRETPFAL